MSMKRNGPWRRISSVIFYGTIAVAGCARPDSAAPSASSSSAGGHGSAARSSKFDSPACPVEFEHMRLDVRLSESDIKSETLSAVVTHRFHLRPEPGKGLFAERASLGQLTLDAVGLDVKKVEIAGAVAGGREPNWAQTEFHQANGELTIDLAPAVREGQHELVRIEYSAHKPTLGLHFVLPDEKNPDRPTSIYTMSEPLQARYWLP